MEKVYLISQNNISLEYDDKSYTLHADKYICIENIDNKTKLKLCEASAIYTPAYLNLAVCHNDACINVLGYKNNKFIEIISVTNKKLHQKLNTKNSEIYIFNNYISINYDTKFYNYYYINENNNYCLEKDNKIYIFNKNNLIVFDINNLSFNHLKCHEFKSKDNVFELLCKIQKNNNYFIHYKFNLTNENLTIKKYNKLEISYSNYSLPFIFFYLVKNDFEIAKNLIADTLNYEDIKNYFSSYNAIYEINGEYFLFANTKLNKINFVISNNKITDLD